jgi:hypothetical protein
VIALRRCRDLHADRSFANSGAKEEQPMKRSTPLQYAARWSAADSCSAVARRTAKIAVFIAVSSASPATRSVASESPPKSSASRAVCAGILDGIGRI